MTDEKRQMRLLHAIVEETVHLSELLEEMNRAIGPVDISDITVGFYGQKPYLTVVSGMQKISDEYGELIKGFKFPYIETGDVRFIQSTGGSEE